MIHNNLFINRLLIYTDEGVVAFDENFHKGINIIRGDNSSGKSTITHFIFFVLGGAFHDFVPEGRKCSVVYAQVEMEGATITIKRYLKDEKEKINPKAPIFFFWGTLDESLEIVQNGEWQKFGYNTTANLKSFSNVIFENLGLPIVKGDNNITIHQILRLLYIDQESPTSSLFYYENFDSQITRETVADLLLGIYNEELYENKKRLIAATKELEEIKSEVKATKKFFPNPLTLNPIHINSIIENREKEIQLLEEEIILIANKTKDVAYDESMKLEFQKLKELSIEQRRLVSDLEEAIEKIAYDVEDTKYFIATLNTKIKALRNSIKTREFLGNLPSEYCPECLTRIKITDARSSKCKLCKEDIDESYGVVQARRMEQEISFQIMESQKLLKINERTLLENKAKYEAEEIKLHQIQRQVNSTLKNVKTYNDEKLGSLYTNKGFLEGEILQYKTMLENAELYKSLISKKDELKNEVDYLKLFIFSTEKKQFELRYQINETIKEEALYLLNNDLDRQDEFKNADEFFIDYSNNIAFLSSKYSKYSASSNFYLKVTSRFAIFLASLSIERMRFPRFIFADNMEDKGIELERAQNLQHILIKRLNDFDANNYQMIYTTSYITDELNNSPYVIGEYYSKENPSLKNIIK